MAQKRDFKPVVAFYGSGAYKYAPHARTRHRGLKPPLREGGKNPPKTRLFDEVRRSDEK